MAQSFDVAIEPLAEREHNDAFEYYDVQQSGLGDAFRRTVWSTLEAPRGRGTNCPLIIVRQNRLIQSMIDRFILILRQGAFGTVLVTMLIWGCYRTTGSEESDPDDMPPDFEVAEQVPVSVVLTAGENKYNCRYDDEEDNAYATVVDGEIRLLFTGCFVCETLNRKAHVDREEGGYSVLFTSPSVSGACGTTVLDLRLYLGPGEAGDRVAVYMPSTQEESGVTLVAETRADAEPVDCHSLPPCDMETPCEPSEERDDRPICAHLSTCGGSYCIWQEEACLMACGDTDCALSESHPLTPIC